MQYRPRVWINAEAKRHTGDISPAFHNNEHIIWDRIFINWHKNPIYLVQQDDAEEKSFHDYIYSASPIQVLPKKK